MKQQREGMLVKYGRILREQSEQRRKEDPLAYGTFDKDVLIVEEVAAILRCSVDQVLRINPIDLPKHAGAGKKNLYLRHELISYIESLEPKNFNKNSLPRHIKQKSTVETDAKVLKFNSSSALSHLRGLDNG